MRPAEIAARPALTFAIGAFLGICMTWLLFRTPYHSTPSNWFQSPHIATNTSEHDKVPGHRENQYGRIHDKVATITDTTYTSRLLPLILHFHAVLSPDWPIIFFTSQEMVDMHLSPTAGNNLSAVWHQAVEEGRVTIRIIPEEFDLKSRNGVNKYLSRPWLWEQLAPAKNVLIFQADAIICANSKRRVDDFLQWDFIGAGFKEYKYNGGLSLRNRNMTLDIINEGHSWEDDIANGTWSGSEGEDIYFSRKMLDRGANLPSLDESIEFAVEESWQVVKSPTPLGYHKVHKRAIDKLGEITAWCPEIALAAAGALLG